MKMDHLERNEITNECDNLEVYVHIDKYTREHIEFRIPSENVLWKQTENTEFTVNIYLQSRD